MKRKDLGKFFATSTITSVADVERTLDAIIGRLYQLFLLIAVIMIIWSAYNFLASGGDEEKVNRAKRILLYTIIAVVVALLATSLDPLLRSL
jgi:fumarate reductase subunit D